MLSQNICIRNSTCECYYTIVYSEFPFEIVSESFIGCGKCIGTSIRYSQVFTVYTLYSSIFTIDSYGKFILFRSNDLIICLGEIISEVATIAYQHRIYEIFATHEYILTGSQLSCNLLIGIYSRSESI